MSLMVSQGFGDGGTGSRDVAPPPSPGAPARRSGIGLGIALIVLGVVFLAAQFAPGVVWWQLWPLIVILVGGVQIVTPDSKDGWGAERVMDGIGTVLIGGVLLGNTTGFISWGVWWTLLMLWPVLLVAIGLRIIGKGIGQSWIKALGPVAIWLAIAYAVAVSLSVRPFSAASSQPFVLNVPVGQVEEAKLTLEGGAGDIEVTGDSGQLVTASGRSPLGSPTLEVKRNGAFATVDVGIGKSGPLGSGVGLASGKLKLDLSSQVVWDAELRTGASSLEADFSELQLRNLVVKSGASSVDVKLGPLPDEVSRTQVTVKAGVSSVKIVLPRDVEAKVVSQSGLSSTDVAGDFQQESGGVWRTPGYASAERAYDIAVESGVGSVTIERE